jgi:hypothetical protein
VPRLAALLLLVLAGCDPLWEVRGSVLPEAPAVRGAALPGALVVVRCPRGGPAAHGFARTEPDGTFLLRDAGFMSLERCTVEVSAQGYETRVYPVRDHCVRPYDDHRFCWEAEVKAVLRLR